MKICSAGHSIAPNTEGSAPRAWTSASLWSPVQLPVVVFVCISMFQILTGGLAAQQSATKPDATGSSAESATEAILPRAETVTVVERESSAKSSRVYETESIRSGTPRVFSAKQEPDSPAMDPAILAEIKAIRARLGGGVAQHLDGILAQPEGTDTPQSTTAEPFSCCRSTLETVFDEEIKQLADIPGSPPMPSASIPSERGTATELTLANRLRTAARYLELAAAELEEVSEFSDADRLRQQAHLLRLRVR